MPSTPKIVTRSETTSSNTTQNLNKGSKLTFAEMDSNFIELKNGAIGVVADDSSTLDVKAGDTLYIQGGSNVTTSTDSAGVLTINATGGDSLGDLTAIGSTISSPSNAAITLDPSGTGTIELNANTNVTGNLTASGSLNTDGIEIHDNNIKATRTNDDLILQTNNTGIVALEGNVRVGEDRASGAANATVTGGTGQNLSLIGGNADAGEVKVMAGPANGSGESGEIFLKPGAAAGKIFVGSGSGDATLTSNGAHGLILNTNSGTNSGSISIGDGANDNIYIQPHQGGTGLVEIGNAGTLSTGDGGGGRVKVAGITFQDPVGNSGGRKNFTAMDIPFSADGSTSSDMRIRLDSNADPIIEFNKASDGNNGAKIKVLDGSLLLQTEGVNSSQGNIRIDAAGDITLDASGNLNLGSGTIVVSGNKMFTDASNEDFELLANGTGNISMLSQANMNSNKIINVTDPGAAQDAATKAYVDTQVSGVAAGQGFKVTGDDSAGVDIPEAGTLYIQGGTNVTTATDSAGVVTINAADNSLSLIDEDSFSTNSATRPPSQQSVKAYVDTQDANIASDTLTLTNKTFDVEGTGNSISNIDVADLKSGVLDTDISSVSGSDDTIASAKAIKTYVDSQVSGVGSANTGDITFVGSTMISPSNADITLNPAGTGKVNINAVYTLPNADGSANQVLGTNGSGVLSFRDPTAINIDGGVADSTYTSVPTIDGGTA